MNEEIENAARDMAKDVFESEYGKKAKAGIWICGFTKLSSSKKTKCHYCKRVCYYDTKLKINFKKNHIKICCSWNGSRKKHVCIFRTIFWLRSKRL